MGQQYTPSYLRKRTKRQKRRFFAGFISRMPRCTLWKCLVAFGAGFFFYVILSYVYLFGDRSCLPNTIAPRLDGQRSIKPNPSSTFEDSESIGKGLNQHIWRNNCLSTIEQLCHFPIFPNAPDDRSFARNTNIILPANSKVDSYRLFGYLRPQWSGEYQFAVASNGFAEVWLSLNKNSKDGRRVAHVFDQRKPLMQQEFPSLNSQLSKGIYLNAGRRYFFDLIYAQGLSKQIENKFFQVVWQTPGETEFQVIDEHVLSPYVNDIGKGNLKIYDEAIPEVQTCIELKKHTSFEAMPKLQSKAVYKGLYHCDYEPSYLIDPSVNVSVYNWKKYHGVRKYAIKTFSYPFTIVDGITRDSYVRPTFYAEYPLDSKDANSVVDEYVRAIDRAYPGKYLLEDIQRVEKKEDPLKGNRYLLQLKVKDLASGTSYSLAEYVYQPRGRGTSLCYPTGMQWKRTADVYLVLTSKNLGRWVHHFIKNVEQIVRETNDEHLHVVIFDFDSPDINLKNVLKNSSLKKYHFIKKAGNYSRTLSLTEAIESIPDPSSIIVTVDLHLDIGSEFITQVRKHCIKGRTVYSPQIISLSCGASSARPRGYWYHYSYGTIAMYKEDWDRFGGFSEQTFTWGGEDWDIIDGIVKQGLEIERLRDPWVYHYYHSKVGMWSGNFQSGQN